MCSLQARQVKAREFVLEKLELAFDGGRIHSYARLILFLQQTYVLRLIRSICAHPPMYLAASVKSDEHPCLVHH